MAHATPWIHGFSDPDDFIGDSPEGLSKYLSCFGWEEDPTGSPLTTWYFHPGTGISVRVDFVYDSKHEPDPISPYLYRYVNPGNRWVFNTRMIG